MHTQLFIKIDAKSEQEACEILSNILLKVKTHSFPWPHDNNCGTWVFKWSNFNEEEEDYDE